MRTMNKYKVGQEIRVEWPDKGVEVKGTLEEERSSIWEPTDGPVLYVPACGGYIDPSMDGDGRVVTILREPPPEEPTGKWALFKDNEGFVWIRYCRRADPWSRIDSPYWGTVWAAISDRGGEVMWAGEQQ